MHIGLASQTYELVAIAETGDRFSDFAPYVASINDNGMVAFQATHRAGGFGIHIGDGDAVRTVIAPDDPFSDIYSHPDINRDGAVCFYATHLAHGPATFLCRDAHVIPILRQPSGPLGPTMNDAGQVALRATPATENDPDANGVYIASTSNTACLAATGGPFSAFHGLPVVNAHGTVAFRVDRSEGDQQICLSDGTQCKPIVATGGQLSQLGAFPCLNDGGTVILAATRSTGGTGIFAAVRNELRTIIDSDGAFETFRGALINNAGTVIFYATTRSGQFGIFTGPNPEHDRLLGIGDALLGSTVVEFALNPVSINERGQLAIRVRLADDRQFIVRADPTTS